MEVSQKVNSNKDKSGFRENELPESLVRMLDERSKTLDSDYLTVEESFRRLNKIN